MTGLSWMPWITETAVREARNGSSPKYSKLRPLNGVRAMFMPGANITLMPLLCASEPMVRPSRRCRSGFQVAAWATPEGNVVVEIWRPATPEPASLSTRSGMQSSGWPFTCPAVP